MAIKTVRRLPGIQFEARAPQLSEALPRMDVAIFVGFAASGPLDVPVAVEDFAQFTAVFGEPAPLAWDELRSEQVYAHLAPAVKAFFDNGGRRCWVIRVAGDQAVLNYFPIPALACAEFDGRGHLKDIRPAFAQACSAGSWSDALRVSATVVSRSLSVTAFDPVAEQLDLSAESAKGLEPGD